MQMFKITQDLRAIYPDVFALALRVTGIRPDLFRNTDADLEDAAESVRRRLSGVESVAELPAVKAWREAYASAGVKPSRFRSSIEALVRRAAKGPLPPVFPLVDLYNAASLRHLVPLGAADADLIRGPIALRLCDPASDSFTPLGAEASDYPLQSTIPVYASGSTIMCWCFNSRDAAPTALRPSTTNALFFTEGIAEWQLTSAISGLEELGSRLADLDANVSIDSIERFTDSHG
jgi:DNA/RNA-binding domain of Phe-tRNA-synthetase-like protein